MEGLERKWEGEQTQTIQVLNEKDNSWETKQEKKKEKANLLQVHRVCDSSEVKIIGFHIRSVSINKSAIHTRETYTNRACLGFLVESRREMELGRTT